MLNTHLATSHVQIYNIFGDKLVIKKSILYVEEKSSNKMSNINIYCINCNHYIFLKVFFFFVHVVD